MKKLFLLLLPAMLTGALCRAQSTVREELHRDNSVDFILEGNGATGVRTVLLRIASLRNCDRKPGAQYHVVESDGVFLTLHPRDSRLEIGYTYDYRVVDAWLKAPVDRSFVYRLPVAADRTAEVAMHRIADEEVPDRTFVSYGFACKAGDPLIAARRGLVKEVRGPGAVKGADPAAQPTYIYVEHADGSIARYGATGPVAVGKGDTVLPSTELATAAADGEFAVAFYRVVPDDLATGFAVRTESFEPYFATDRGQMRLSQGERYRPVVDDALLTREMTKKELKRFRKQ